MVEHSRTTSVNTETTFFANSIQIYLIKGHLLDQILNVPVVVHKLVYLLIKRLFIILSLCYVYVYDQNKHIIINTFADIGNVEITIFFNTFCFEIPVKFTSIFSVTTIYNSFAIRFVQLTVHVLAGRAFFSNRYFMYVYP